MEGIVKYPNFQFPSTNKHLTASNACAIYEISLQHFSLLDIPGNGKPAEPFIGRETGPFVSLSFGFFLIYKMENN